MTASLKVLQSAVLLGSGGLLSSSALLSMAVGLEVFAAIVIVFAPSSFAHRFALAVYSGLACIAAWAWWTQTDCGCFGTQTPKGVPLLVDVTAIGLLVLSRKAVRKQSDGGGLRLNRRLRVTIVVALLVALLVTGLLGWRMDSASSTKEMPAWLGDNLVGMQLPLLFDERFDAVVPQSGDGLLVLLRPDCRHCQELAADWLSMNTQLTKNVTVIGISVSHSDWAVMPGVVSANPVTPVGGFVLRWDAVEEPFVAAPTLIAVRDRVVVNVKSGEEAIKIMVQDSWLTKLLVGKTDEKD